jgi:hypothetical protein
MDQQILVNSSEMKATRALSIMIDNFNKPVCTNRLLLEVCQVHDIAESVRMEVIVEQSVCYVDMNKYMNNADIQKEAVDCALTDKIECI